jgi:hypothetical protein
MRPNEAHARFEFGVKISVAAINRVAPGGQFVVGIRALPGDPYDGHTLAAQFAQTERLTGVAIERAYVDRTSGPWPRISSCLGARIFSNLKSWALSGLSRPAKGKPPGIPQRNSSRGARLKRLGNLRRHQTRNLQDADLGGRKGISLGT